MIGIVGNNPCERTTNVCDIIEDTNNTHDAIDGIIDIDNNRFPESQEDLGRIINSIDAEINGLF